MLLDVIKPEKKIIYLILEQNAEKNIKKRFSLFFKQNIFGM